jgi:transformation/transcription domain-associated protein
MELTIDPFSIIWFKKLHKFYADYDKLQMSVKNLNAAAAAAALNNNAASSTNNENTNNQATSTNLNSSNLLLNTQNQRLRGLLAILNDSNYQTTRHKFLNDFNSLLSQQSNNSCLINVFEFINKIKKWIKIIEKYISLTSNQNYSNNQQQQQLDLDQRFRFIVQFCSKLTSEIELPGEYLIPRATNYYIKINRFMPYYDQVEKYNTFSRRIYIRGHNGKIYPFLIANEISSPSSSGSSGPSSTSTTANSFQSSNNNTNNYYELRREEHIMQLMRMSNTLFMKQKETSRRCLSFSMPRMASLSAEVRMIEDDLSSISLLNILNKSTRRSSSDLLSIYFDLLLFNSSSTTTTTTTTTSSKQQHQLDVYRQMLSNNNNNLNRTTLRDFMMRILFKDATEYFSFRKVFTIQLAIFNMFEYALNLCKSMPDSFYLSQESSGLCENIRLKFDLTLLNTTTTSLNNIYNNNYGFDFDFSNQNTYSNLLSSNSNTNNKLNNNFNNRIQHARVPFRLTPNMREYLTLFGINGLMSSAMISMAKCLAQSQYNFNWLLRAILKDEIIILLNKKVSNSCFVYLY